METSMINAMCRCCASEGVFKDVKTTYHWMGEEEIYADMLKECFDVCLFTPEEGSDGGICEVCITQLRNAVNFKKQVLHTEEQFKRHVQNKLFKPSIVKVEVDEDERNDSDDNNASAEEGFSGTEYEIPIKKEVPDEPKSKKRAAAAKATTSRAKKAKTEIGEPSTKREHHNRVAKEIKNEATTVDSELKTELPKASRTEVIKHRMNIKEILLCTNATPIRRYGGIGYTCCYCDKQYVAPEELKIHTQETHTDVNLANFMKHMNMSEYVVKLDVTNLTCNLCNTTIKSLENLFQHLKTQHERKIYTDIKNHIFPFQFGSGMLKCMICSNSFNKFRVLANHMHLHYRNFICTVCDSGFVNRNALAQHSLKHNTGVFTCDYCPKSFSTQLKKKLHERNSHTHQDTMNRCGYCSEAFKDYRKKEAHLAKAHGVKVLTPVCQACDRVFSNRKLLNIHVKRDHLLERPHKCSECEMTFFSTTGLKNHMVKHTGSREFQCSVCLKSFGRKKTLNSHMRIHDAEKRYKCEHCGQAFVQKCSWKGHMRSKHGEIV